MMVTHHLLSSVFTLINSRSVLVYNCVELCVLSHKCVLPCLKCRGRNLTFRCFFFLPWAGFSWIFPAAVTPSWVWHTSQRCGRSWKSLPSFRWTQMKTQHFLFYDFKTLNAACFMKHSQTSLYSVHWCTWSLAPESIFGSCNMDRQLNQELNAAATYLISTNPAKSLVCNPPRASRLF